MVVAAFTFGSFGAIASLLGLVCGLREALHEVTSAPVSALKTRLFEQLAVIQTYLSVMESSDRDAIVQLASHHQSTVDGLRASMNYIQSRFDVGIPAFQFCDQRTGAYYQPFARTSIARLVDLFSAVNYYPLQLDLPVSGESFMQTLPLARKQDSVIVPCIFKINCFFFREAAFGEWQVLLGFRLLDQANVSQLTSTLNIFKALVERRHTLGATCNCDGAHCHARFQREIKQSVYQTRCLECYSAAASIIFRKALSSWVEMARNYKLWDTVQRGIERETTLCPDPDYVHTTIIPALRKATRPGIDDMLRLFEAAPKLERPDAFSNPQAPSTSTLQDLQSFRGWHHNPVLRFWDLL